MDHRGVRLELLLFGGGRRPVEEQELGPVQSDPGGPALQAGGGLGGEFDVPPEPDLDLVERLGGEPREPREHLEPFRTRGGCLAVTFQRRPVGVKHDEPFVAIDDHRTRMSGAVEEPADADHGGNLQRLGDDRRVAGAAAGLGREAEDQARVEAGGLARRQVGGEQDARLQEPLSHLRARLADQVAEDPLADVADVGGAGGEVRIGDLFEFRGVRLEDFADRVFGRDPVAFDPRAGVATERRVGHHLGVRPEDVGILRAEVLAGLGLGGLRFDAGGQEGAIEAFELAGDRLHGDVAVWESLPARVDDHRRADRDARTDGDPTQGLHRCGFNR